VAGREDRRRDAAPREPLYCVARRGEHAAARTSAASRRAARLCAARARCWRCGGGGGGGGRACTFGCASISMHQRGWFWWWRCVMCAHVQGCTCWRRSRTRIVRCCERCCDRWNLCCCEESLACVRAPAPSQVRRGGGSGEACSRDCASLRCVAQCLCVWRFVPPCVGVGVSVFVCVCVCVRACVLYVRLVCRVCCCACFGAPLTLRCRPLCTSSLRHLRAALAWPRWHGPCCRWRSPLVREGAARAVGG
jgi:hypothetical protein